MYKEGGLPSVFVTTVFVITKIEKNINVHQQGMRSINDGLLDQCLL